MATETQAQPEIKYGRRKRDSYGRREGDLSKADLQNFSVKTPNEELIYGRRRDDLHGKDLAEFKQMVAQGELVGGTWYFSLPFGPEHAKYESIIEAFDSSGSFMVGICGFGIRDYEELRKLGVNFVAPEDHGVYSIKNDILARL